MYPNLDNDQYEILVVINGNYLNVIKRTLACITQELCRVITYVVEWL